MFLAVRFILPKWSGGESGVAPAARPPGLGSPERSRAQARGDTHAMSTAQTPTSTSTSTETSEQRELRELREFKAQVESEKAAAIAAKPAAFVPFARVITHSAGYDRYAHEGTPEYDANGQHVPGSGRRGMFVTQQPKLELHVHMSATGDPKRITGNAKFWAAVVKASPAIADALANGFADAE